MNKRNSYIIATVLFVAVLAMLLKISADQREAARQRAIDYQNPPVINTNAEELTEDMGVQLVEDDVAYFENANGFYVRPDDDIAYPGVVMIHENRGLNGGIRDMARQLAREGYQVLAVDLLGPPVETQEEARALTASFDRAKGVENMREAVSYLREHGATRVASIGWCFGGGQSLALALSGEELNGTILYYGTPLVTDKQQLGKITWPVLGIFGDQDQAIPTETVEQFDAALDELDIPNEVHIYPGVGHAFANPSRPSYAPSETKDAWEKTTAFLRANLQ